MKRGLLLGVFSLWLVGGAQSLTRSTIREIYNYSVGDTLETSCQQYNIGGTQGCEGSVQIMQIIISRYDNGDTILYRIKQNDHFSWQCNFQFGGSSMDSVSFNQTITQLDSTIFWYHTYHVLGCDSFHQCFTDTVYRDSSLFNYKKVNEHWEGNLGWAAYDTVFADGLGEVKNNFFSEDNMLEQGGCGLSYYHKANGEIWGAPFYFNIISDVKDMVGHNTIKISPNPASTTLTIQLENTFPPTSFQLFDLSGRMVLQQELRSSTSVQIDISAVSKGMYLYHLASEESNTSGKLVVE
jgi:hypothetical protein